MLISEHILSSDLEIKILWSLSFIISSSCIHHQSYFVIYPNTSKRLKNFYYPKEGRYIENKKI